MGHGSTSVKHYWMTPCFFEGYLELVPVPHFVCYDESRSKMVSYGKKVAMKGGFSWWWRVVLVVPSFMVQLYRGLHMPPTGAYPVTDLMLPLRKSKPVRIMAWSQWFGVDRSVPGLMLAGGRRATTTIRASDKVDGPAVFPVQTPLYGHTLPFTKVPQVLVHFLRVEG